MTSVAAQTDPRTAGGGVATTGIPVTVAHDYFTQRGGAERVAAALINSLHPDRVITAVHSPSTTFEIDSDTRVETTFLQLVRRFRRDPRRALPAIPFAWRLVPKVEEGVV